MYVVYNAVVYNAVVHNAVVCDSETNISATQKSVPEHKPSKRATMQLLQDKSRQTQTNTAKQQKFKIFLTKFY